MTEQHLTLLETKLKETLTLIDLLEFAEIRTKIDEALQLTQLIHNQTPHCILCNKQLQLNEPDKPTEQYICGECLLDPHRRDEINQLIKSPPIKRNNPC